MSSHFSQAALKAEGFNGWVPLVALDPSQVPSMPGVYVVYRSDVARPHFLSTSNAGRFKKRDPSVDESILRSKWVPGASTVYIGRASQLRRRLRQYQWFGAGKPVGHWGGRYVWQLADSGALLVAWRPVSSAKSEEVRLLDAFISAHGRLPFANIAMPSREDRGVCPSPGARTPMEFPKVA